MLIFDDKITPRVCEILIPWVAYIINLLSTRLYLGRRIVYLERLILRMPVSH